MGNFQNLHFFFFLVIPDYHCPKMLIVSGSISLGSKGSSNLCLTGFLLPSALSITIRLDAFKVIDDPFGSGKKIGIIKALNPDLSIIHGYAADRYGNTILCQGDSIVDEYSALGQ